MSANEHAPDDTSGPALTGQDVLYRERGVTALDVQRAGDALLRLGQKPSIAAIRTHLGGGSPNTLGPLLEKYWSALGTRLAAGPEALERVPESLARATEALWRRALDEARARSEALSRSPAPSAKGLAALESKVSELTAALAESRARSSEMESQLLVALKGQIEARDQIRQLTELLKADRQLRARDHSRSEAQGRELAQRRSEILSLARRRLASRVGEKTHREVTTKASQKGRPIPKKAATAAASNARRPTLRSGRV